MGNDDNDINIVLHTQRYTSTSGVSSGNKPAQKPSHTDTSVRTVNKKQTILMMTVNDHGRVIYPRILPPVTEGGRIHHNFVTDSIKFDYKKIKEFFYRKHVTAYNQPQLYRKHVSLQPTTALQ